MRPLWTGASEKESNMGKQKKWMRWKKDLQFQSLLVPALVLYILFVALPLVTTFYYSITNYNRYHLNNYHLVGLKNYWQIGSMPMLKTALLNSIKYALGMTFFQSLLAIPLAVLLNRKIRLSNLYRAAFFLPAMFSPLVMGFLWQVMMGPQDKGLINRFLLGLGLAPFDFLSSANGMNSIILTQVWQWTGWAVVIYLANLQTIPEDMLEAGRIDGASNLQMFFRLILPLLCPAVTVVSVSSLVGGLKVYDIVQAMTGGGPGYATETIITAMIKTGFTDGNYALAAAFGVIFFALVMLFTMVLLAVLKKWGKAVS